MSNAGGNNSPPPPYSYSNEQKLTPNFEETNNFQPQQFNPSPYPPTVNVTQPPPLRVITRTALFGPLPVEMDCPYCHVNFSRQNFNF